MAKPRVKIKKFRILDWTIPMYGNNRLYPYYHIDVLGEDGTERVVLTKEDGPYTYFTFRNKRYYFVNTGTLYNPKLEILEEGRKE